MLQRVADANGKFLHVSSGYAGSIHDACVLRMSSLLTAIEKGDILHSSKCSLLYSLTQLINWQSGA